MDIFSQFVSTVKKHPDKIAVLYKEKQLSFSELYRWTNFYSERLRRVGIQRNDIVAFCLSNTPEAVAATLSIISIGAIALPINMQLPQGAITAILEDSGAQLFLYGEQTDFSDFPFRSLFLPDIVVGIDPPFINETPPPLSKMGDFAFCVYTSGSTGKQKGMLLPHQGVLNHIHAKKKILEISEESIVCQSFHNGFVASIWQILTPLIFGAQLVICTVQDIRNPLALLKRAEKTEATVIALLPQLLMSYCKLLENGHERLKLSHLKTVVLTGEQVPPSVVHTFYKYYTIPLINAYGQSECSDDTLHYKIPFDFDEDTVPIGMPIPHVDSYILDEQGNIVDSEHQVGELCLSGICLGTPVSASATCSSFVQIAGIDTRVFRSGDIVYRSKGIYYYCGRKDNMVKIRGHRVFLEEIERTLEAYPTVHKVLVIPIYHGQIVKGFEAQVLCEDKLDEKALTDFLMQRLPSYAIPQVYKKVTEFKKLPNGKILRRNQDAGN